MSILNIMCLLSLVISVVGVVMSILSKKSLPSSVSAIVYGMKNKYAWSAWVWLVTLLLTPSLIDKLPEFFKVFGFFTIAALLFCGALPIVDKSHKYVHNFLGIAAGILSQICISVINPWWLLLWILLVIFFSTIVFVEKPWADKIYEACDGKGVFLVEVTSMATLYCGLLL